MSIHELFGELHALEFQGLDVRLHTSIQRHSDLPRTRKHLRILDRGLVHQMVWRQGRVTFYHMQGIAMEVSGAVEPGFIVLSGYVNHQRVTVPTSDGPAHPGIGRSLGLAIHIDHARRTGKLVGEQDLLGCLNDLKGKADIRGPWNAWQIALGLGVARCVVEVVRGGMGEPLFKILFLLRRRPRLIRDLSTLDDALSCRLRAYRAHKLRKGRRSRSMRLDIPI